MKGASRLKFSIPNPNIKNDLRWIVLLVILFLIIILAWPNPASGAAPHQNATITPEITLTPTPIPVEFLSTPDQTSGIICGSAVYRVNYCGRERSACCAARTGKPPQNNLIRQAI